MSNFVFFYKRLWLARLPSKSSMFNLCWIIGYIFSCQCRPGIFLVQSLQAKLTWWRSFSLSVKDVSADSTFHSLINSSDFSASPSHVPTCHEAPVFITRHDLWHCLYLPPLVCSSSRHLSLSLSSAWPGESPLQCCLSWGSFLTGRCVEVGACCYWSSIVPCPVPHM